MVLTSCGHDSVTSKLGSIDSLLYQNLYDSAYNEIKRVNINNVEAKDEAYYNMLKITSLSGMGVIPENDSVIDRSIECFKNEGDLYLTARSYYVKGWIQLNRHEMNQAMKSLKTAEQMFPQFTDDRLKAKTMAAIASISTMTGEYETGLTYYKLGLNHALSCNDDDLVIYFYSNLCNVFGNMGMTDSTVYYAKQTLSLLKNIPDEKQSWALLNLAATYEDIDIEKAKQYVKLSIAIHPTVNAYHLLAKKCRKRKRLCSCRFLI